MIKKLLFSLLLGLMSLMTHAQSPGNALNFDGTNDFVSVPFNPLQNTANFTFECWVRLTGGSGHRAVVSTRATGANTKGFIIYATPSNTWEFWTGNNSTTGWNYLQPNVPVVLNKWTHLAATYDGATMKFYIDGKLVGSTGCTMTLNTTDVFKIGAGDTPGNSFFFMGNIDEVRLWSEARTAAQIKSAMLNLVPVNTTNLVSYYNFDQGTAAGANAGTPSLTDKTANALNGTLNNFTLTGATSNFVESYAMVVPTAVASTVEISTDFTANWTAPAVGVVDRYLLDVATDSLFTNVMAGYNKLDVGTVTSYQVHTTASCYYRVRAEKASVTAQGIPSNYIKRSAFNYTSIPSQGYLYTANSQDSAYSILSGNSALTSIVSFEFRLYKNNQLIKTNTYPATYTNGITNFSNTFALYKGINKYKIEMYHTVGTTLIKDTTIDNILCVGTIPYSVPKTQWAEGNGAHRAVLKISQAASGVRVRLLWRRHDTNPASRQIIVLDSVTGLPVTNIYRNVVNNELCDIVIGTVNKGTYYLYYLPYNVGISVGGYFNGSYKTQEAAANSTWVTTNSLTSTIAQSILPDAEVTLIQARTKKDSFYPMELIPTAAEKALYLTTNSADYLVFPENRDNKIAMRDQLAYKWTLAIPDTTLSLTTARNEYYCYQLGVFANTKNINTVKLTFDDLKTAAGDIIPASKITCFNTDGVNPSGNKFTKVINVPQSTVQPMWVGVDIAPDQVPGLYTGYVRVSTSNSTAKKVRVNLTVSSDFSSDRGDSILANYSRLRWLNSTLGLDSLNSADYTPIQKISDTQYSILGRTITIATDGMPSSVTAWGNEILNSQIKFVIETTTGIETFPAATLKSSRVRDGIVVNKYSLDNANFNIQLETTIESDGYCHYTDTILAKKTVSIKDIRLEFPLNANIGQYMMGFGQAGSVVPAVGSTVTKKWSSSFQTFWTGNPNAGIFCRLLGATYAGPMVAPYQPAPPTTWNNGGLGGVKFANTSNGLLTTAFSGARSMTANQKMTFEYALLITPVKALDTKSQFTNKYYHALDNAPLTPNQTYQNLGVKVINFHHGNNVNPYINYPFITIDSIRKQTSTWHPKGVKIKLYMTIRELTYFVEEIWALRSFGTEILGDGGGGGFPWLQEHLISGYSPQWYIHRDLTIPADASIQNSTGDTRWYNYYVEALKWLVVNTGIDGIYLDDVAYDRSVIKRIRKAMESVKPGCMIDLHSNTGYSNGPATQYTEFFPYVDRLWFGESFNYNNMAPDYWLTEASGIPFGLISDEIYVNNNLQRGMIYGTSSRSPSSSVNPDEVWKVWNSFGIQDAKMIGYWDTAQVVTTSNKNILATTYKKRGSSLIAVASWNATAVSVTLNVNLTKLDLSPTGLTVTIPTITNYQTARSFTLASTLTVNAGGGYLILLTGTPLSTGVSTPVSNQDMFALSPNPATSVANVTYHQALRGHINMAMYDVNGKKVKEVLNATQDAGDYLLQIQVADLTKGIYFLHQNNEKGVSKTLRIVKQ